MLLFFIYYNTISLKKNISLSNQYMQNTYLSIRFLNTFLMYNQNVHRFYFFLRRNDNILACIVTWDFFFISYIFLKLMFNMKKTPLHTFSSMQHLSICEQTCFDEEELLVLGAHRVGCWAVVTPKVILRTGGNLRYGEREQRWQNRSWCGQALHMNEDKNTTRGQKRPLNNLNMCVINYCLWAIQSVSHGQSLVVHLESGQYAAVQMSTAGTNYYTMDH